VYFRTDDLCTLHDIAIPALVYFLLYFILDFLIILFLIIIRLGTGFNVMTALEW
jgi:hypothetical protein